MKEIVHQNTKVSMLHKQTKTHKDAKVRIHTGFHHFREIGQIFIPWVPETFLTRFPISVKSLYIVTLSWLRPTTKMCRPSANTKNSPHTCEKPLVPRVFPGIRNNNNNPPFCKAPSKENGSGQYPVWMTKNPRRGDFRELKSKKYLRETCHWTPPPSPPQKLAPFWASI